MRHLNVLLASACALGATTGAKAEETDTRTRDLFQAGFLYDETTDDLDRYEGFFTYRNNRRSLYWPWEESDADGPDWGVDLRYSTGSIEDVDFDTQRIAAMLGGRIAPALYVEAWLGTHQLDTDLGEDDVLVYEATARITPNEQLELRIRTNRDFLYREGFAPASITEFLSARTHGLTAIWNPLPRLRAIGDFRWRSLSDDNNEQHYSAALLYGLSPSWPWIWIGVGGEWLAYDEQRSSYWSPDEFSSVGLRFEASFPLGESFEAGVAANLNRIDENDVGQGDGEYFDVGLTYHLTPTLRLRLNALHINSIQRGERWSETTWVLSLAGALF